MIDEKVEDELINSLLKHSEHFLLEMNSFYPFGHTVNTNFEIQPVQAWLGNDFPDSQDLIDFLEMSFKKQFEKHEIILSAICIDIFLKIVKNGLETKQDAIEIRLCSVNNNEIIHYKYNKNGDNKIEFIKTE